MRKTFTKQKTWFAILATCVPVTLWAQGHHHTDSIESLPDAVIKADPETTPTPEPRDAAADDVNTDTTPDMDLPPTALPATDAARGESLYLAKCAVCHGTAGKGNGPIAAQIEPKPRNLAAAEYKLRSTATGELPTDADLFRTITYGIRGTAMPAWAGVPVADRWQLIYYIKSMSKRFSEDGPPAAMAIPSAPASDLLMLDRGAQIYVAMDCGKCHGTSGRGDGPSAATMVDTDNKPIFAFDMTRSWKLKSGAEVQDIYKVLATGLNGTPMPSYQGSLSVKDTWALAWYVKSLALDRN